jgi:hypothetical protein
MSTEKPVEAIDPKPPFSYDTHVDFRGFRDLVGREISLYLRFPVAGRRTAAGHLLIVDNSRTLSRHPQVAALIAMPSTSRSTSGGVATGRPARPHCRRGCTPSTP